MTGQVPDQVRENLERIGERLAAACAGADRDPATVRLVAVSKRIETPLLVEACRQGHFLFGENRLPDAVDRQPELEAALRAEGLDPDRLEWHFIGHIQGNKARRLDGRFALLHGVDSLKLAHRLSSLAVEAGRSDRILLEVNISGEEQKHGFEPPAVADVVAEIAALPGLEVLGLMGMARYGADEAELHRTFTLLRETRDAARRADGPFLPELSMGMSGDFEIAVAEGATLVRVGTAIFGPRQY